LCKIFLIIGLLFWLKMARLDVYIYDYLMKKKLHATAKSFMTEGKVALDPVGNGILVFLCDFIRKYRI